MRKQTINIYLTVLALYDNGVLIFSILMLNLPAITDHYQQQSLPPLSVTPTPVLAKVCANMSAGFDAHSCLLALDNNNAMNGTYNNLNNLNLTTLSWLSPQIDYGPHEDDNDTIDSMTNHDNNSSNSLFDRLGRLLFDQNAPPLDLLSASSNLSSSIPPHKNNFFKTSIRSNTSSANFKDAAESLFGQIYTHCFNLSKEEQEEMRQSVIIDHNDTILVQIKQQLMSYLERTAHLRSHLMHRLSVNETSMSYDPMGYTIAHNLADAHECRLPISQLLKRIEHDLDSHRLSHRPHHHRHKTDSDPEPFPSALSSQADIILLASLLDNSHRYIEKLAFIYLEAEGEGVFNQRNDVNLCPKNSEPEDDQPLLQSYVKFVYPMALLSQTGSIWTTCLITIERYLAVCHPLRSLTLSKRSRAIWALVLLSAAALAFNVPRFWEVDTSCGPIRPSWLRRNRIYYHVYYTCLNLSLNYILPLSLLFYLNIRIYSSVRHANEHRNELTRARQSELHLASMLVAIVAIFIGNSQI